MSQKKFAINTEKCPTCGLIAQFIPPSIPTKEKKLLVSYLCPNQHKFNIKRDLL
jgi:hypothetical protein